MLSLYSCCRRLLQLICAVLMQATFQNTTTTKYVIYLCRVRVSFVVCVRVLRWINTYYLCAVFVCRAWQCSVMGGYCLSVDIFYNSFQSLFSPLCSGRNFGSRVLLRQNTIQVVLLWYVADFLLVYIYTLVKRLRDRELRVVLVELRRIQRIFVHKYASYSNTIA